MEQNNHICIKKVLARFQAKIDMDFEEPTIDAGKFPLHTVVSNFKPS